MQGIHAFFVVACGGLLAACGSNDAVLTLSPLNQPAALSTVAQAKQQAAVIGFVLGTGAGAAVPKAAPARHGLAKAVTTQDCDSGSFSFDDESGRTEYNNCVFTSQGLSVTLNGVELEQCAPETGGGAAANRDCSGEFLTTYGEGDAPLRTRVTETQDGGDLRYTELGTLRETLASTQSSETSNFVADALNTLEDIGEGVGVISLDFDRLEGSEEFVFSDNSRRLSFNGNGSFATDAGSRLANCGSGRVRLNTLTPIVVDSGGISRSGELVVSNSGGQSANLLFNADGSVTISAGGNSQTFSNFDDVCTNAG